MKFKLLFFLVPCVHLCLASPTEQVMINPNSHKGETAEVYFARVFSVLKLPVRCLSEAHISIDFTMAHSPEVFRNQIGAVISREMGVISKFSFKTPNGIEVISKMEFPLIRLIKEIEQNYPLKIRVMETFVEVQVTGEFIARTIPLPPGWSNASLKSFWFNYPGFAPPVKQGIVVYEGPDSLYFFDYKANIEQLEATLRGVGSGEK